MHCTHSCTQPGATVPCIKINRISQYKGKKSNPTYTKAITDEGSYKVQLRQLLYGIPYFACNGIGDGYEPGVWLSDARVSVAHRGADGYMVLAMLWQVEEVVYEDVPLLSFTDAKPAFEKEIMAGRLRTVDTIALGYAPYTDLTDPDVFWLLPVWYVKGGYTPIPLQCSRYPVQSRYQTAVPHSCCPC